GAVRRDQAPLQVGALAARRAAAVDVGLGAVARHVHAAHAARRDAAQARAVRVPRARLEVGAGGASAAAAVGVALEAVADAVHAGGGLADVALADEAGALGGEVAAESRAAGGAAAAAVDVGLGAVLDVVGAARRLARRRHAD